jgi:hypothetical protein
VADQAKIGTPWQDGELDAIVADCFDMLSSEVSPIGCGRCEIWHNRKPDQVIHGTSAENAIAIEKSTDTMVYASVLSS